MQDMIQLHEVAMRLARASADRNNITVASALDRYLDYLEYTHPDTCREYRQWLFPNEPEHAAWQIGYDAGRFGWHPMSNPFTAKTERQEFLEGFTSGLKNKENASNGTTV